MNTFTAVVNLCRAPEDLQLGARDCVKLRVADNTFGKSETRFFDAIVSGPDVETARKLSQGDQIVVSGTLQKTSYKAKKGKMKGKTVEQDQMPFAKILQVTKSESFFNGGDEDGVDDADSSTEAPDLEGDGGGPGSGDIDDGAGDEDNPLAGI